MKRTLTICLIICMLFSLTSCSNNKQATDEQSAEDMVSNPVLDESVTDIVDWIYENAELSDDMREAMSYYETVEIDNTNEETILGTGDLSYAQAVCSRPVMSAVAFQFVLIRLKDKKDAQEAIDILKEKADPNKWICASADTTVVESSGDLVLFIMGDTDNTLMIQKAFESL